MTDEGGGDKPGPPHAPPPDPTAVPAPEAPSVDEAWTEASVTAGPEAPASLDPAPPPAPPPPPEPPLLPPAYSESELRDAVGAAPRPEPPIKPRRGDDNKDDDDDNDDDDDGRANKRSRRTIVVAALSIFGGCSIAALVFLGKANSARYVIACEADRVVVQHGRSFPPWGTTALDGPEWQPIKIPPEASCHPRETEDDAELAGWYLRILVDQATQLLTAREVTKVDEANAALQQALLVTRRLKTEGDAKDARGEIDRLLGDVAYWRASARLRSAADTLADAAKQFDAAAAQRPAHFTDAAAWAGYARKLMDDLRAGPAGAATTTFPPLPPPERPTAPPGTALPVEPERGSGDGSAEAAPPPPVTPDAGVPSGGVLL